jgi:hypothetical protein
VKQPQESELGDEELTDLWSTAHRASDFLGTYPELIETLKGCKRHLIIESYGQKHHVGDGESADKVEWRVDDDMLWKASTNDHSWKERSSSNAWIRIGTTPQPI